mmetsp:Transcript_19073/g.39185  ORF Transcript_19073/g.39185 Transcript_19073/m.39185 type:complete len:218 (-) Transcript_19073:344-997(-)
MGIDVQIETQRIDGFDLVVVPSQLVVLGGVEAHAGVVFIEGISHHSRLIVVIRLVELPAVGQTEVVSDLVDLHRYGGAPIVVVKGVLVVRKGVGEPVSRSRRHAEHDQTELVVVEISEFGGRRVHRGLLEIALVVASGGVEVDLDVDDSVLDGVSVGGGTEGFDAELPVGALVYLRPQTDLVVENIVVELCDGWVRCDVVLVDDADDDGVQDAGFRR